MKYFLSYSRRDGLLADKIVETLREVGVMVERDRDADGVGERLASRLHDQMKDADAVLLLLTKASADSKWVGLEYGWARADQKKIVVVKEVGVVPDLPDFDSTVEHIEYDPARYDEMLAALVRTARNMAAGGPSAPRTKATRSSEFIELRSQESEQLFRVTSDEVAESLRPYIATVAEKAIEDFFGRPEWTRFTNLGTLETDAHAVVIRTETLHALMQAAAFGTAKAFGQAGYHAGVSFGVGVVKRFIERSEQLFHARGLPRLNQDLIAAASKIDVASGWGYFDIEKTQATTSELWAITVRIQEDFLSAIFRGATDPKGRNASNTEAFWRSYLEGMSSAALAVAHGVRNRLGLVDQSPPVLSKVVTLRPDFAEGTSIDFRIACVTAPRRATVEDLCREVLSSYVLGDYTAVVTRARSVLEGFVREVADVDGRPSEDISGALRWLAESGPVAGRDAASQLQKARNHLHPGMHETKEATRVGAYQVIQSLVPALLKAVHDISLSDGQLRDFRRALEGGSK